MISRVLSLFFITSLFLGCSDFIKSNKSNEEVIQVETQLSCVKDLKGNIVKVLNSNLKETEINESFGCVDAALTKFQEKFRGHEKEEEFSTKDVTSLLNFFYKDLKITEDMTMHLLKVKYVLVGGHTDSLSKDDVESLKVILTELNKEFIQLAPHFIVYHSQSQLYSEKDIRMAYEQLRMSMGRIIKFSKISKAQYTAHDLFDFLKSFKFELGRFAGDEIKMVAIVDFLSGQHQSLTSETYADIAQSLIDLIEVRALIANKHMPIDVNQAALKSRSLEKFLVNIVRLLSQTPAIKSKQNLELSKLEPLFPLSFQQGDFQMQIPFELVKTAKILVLGGNELSLTSQELDGFQKRIGPLLLMASQLSEKFEKLATGETKISEETLSDINDLFVDAFDVIFYDDALTRGGGSVKVYEKIHAVLKTVEFEKSDLISVLFEELYTPNGFESEEKVIQTLGQTIRMISSWKRLSDKVQGAELRFSDFSDLLTAVSVQLKLQHKPSLFIDRIFRSASITTLAYGPYLKTLQLFFPDLSSRQVKSLSIDRLALFFKGLNEIVKVPIKNLKSIDYLGLNFEEIGQLIAQTDFLTANHSSHFLITHIFENLVQVDPAVRNQMISFLKAVVADRPLQDVAALNSIFRTFKAADALYKKVAQGQKFDLTQFEMVMDFLETSDQMQVKKEIDLILLMTVLETNLLTAKIDPKQIVKLYEKFVSKNPRQMTIEQIGQAKNYIQLTSSATRLTEEFKKLVQYDLLTATHVKNIIGQIKGLAILASGLPMFTNEKSEVDLNNLVSMLSESFKVQFQVPDWLKRVKVLLVGGTRATVKLSEVQKFLVILGAIEMELDHLEKPMQVLFSLDPAQTIEIQQAAEVVKASLRKIIPKTNIALGAPSFKEFSDHLAPKLFSQMDEDSYDRAIELVESIHFFLMGDVQIEDSEGAVQLALSYVDTIKVFRMAISGHMTLEIQSRKQVLNTIGTVQEILDLIQNSPSMLVNGSISLRLLDHVVGYLIRQTKFPIPVSKAVFTDFYRKMIERVFVQENDRDFKQDLVTQQNFDRIRSEFEIVQIIVKALDAGFSGIDPSKVLIKDEAYRESELIRGRIGYILRQHTGSLKRESSELKQRQSHALELYLSEFLNKPSVHFSNGYLLSGNYLDYKNTWIGHFRGFYTRTLARLLIQGWGDRKTTQIDGPGLSKWYSDFKAFGVATKTFDPRTGNGGERSLLEANLFTIDGNGDDQVNFREAVQYIALLTTGGGIQFKNLWSLLENNRCLTNDSDPFGLVYVVKDCAIRTLAANHSQLFYNMNRFNYYLSNLGGMDRIQQYFQSVLNVAVADANKKSELFESSDLRAALMLINYVESVFTAFNSEEKDMHLLQTLSIQEIRIGYPRFEKLIFGFAKKSKGDLLKAYSRDVIDFSKTDGWLSPKSWWKSFGGTALMAKIRCRDSNFTAEENEKRLAREAFIYLLLNGHMNIEWTDSAMSCMVDKEPIKLEGEVDRQELINSFKVLKSVLASGQ